LIRRVFLDPTVRARIAFTILAVSTVFLIAMALAVYIAFENELVASLDDTLRLRAAENLALVNDSVSPPTLTVASDPGGQLAAGEALLRLYDSHATLLFDASPATGIEPAERAVVVQALASNRNVFRTIDLADNEDYRVVATTISSGGTVDGVLVTGIERSRVDKPLEILRVILFIAVPATALSLGVAGYWIARRAMHPVAVMTETARRITLGDLKQRIDGVIRQDELGQLAATLNLMISRIAETVSRERRFTSDASHELRTPLTAIETGIDVTLAQERSPAEYRRVLGIVRQNAQRLDDLSRKLLLLSRLDADQVRGGFAVVELNGLVEAVIASFEDSNPKVDVHVDLADQPVPVRGDFELLGRTLFNLLENSVVHGSADVVVWVSVEILDGNRVEIAVEDNGSGIPPDLAPEIFERFRRGDAARSGQGSGLGLAIVSAIMQAHGGVVSFETPKHGSGARFALTIPTAPASID
jgi:two-component system, OmpR family, sensor kinase